VPRGDIAVTRSKIRWFRELLRTTGHSIQVVLLTCRPEDYLLPD